MPRDENPLAFVGRFLDSTPFLSCVLLAIASMVAWASGSVEEYAIPCARLSSIPGIAAAFPACWGLSWETPTTGVCRPSGGITSVAIPANAEFVRGPY